MLYCDWMKRNNFTGTGGREEVSLGMEGEEDIYWDWSEKNSCT